MQMKTYLGNLIAVLLVTFAFNVDPLTVGGAAILLATSLASYTVSWTCGWTTAWKVIGEAVWNATWWTLILVSISE
jgi:hypothetical protein